MRHINLILTIALLAGAAQAMTLDEAIAIAKQRSLAQQRPRVEREKARGQLNEAWSNALPQIDGTVGYQRAMKKGKIFFPNPETGAFTALELDQDNALQANVTLNQPLFTFGRVAAGVRGAKAYGLAAQHAVDQQDMRTELDVMQRFWAVLTLRDVVSARELSLAVSDSALLRAERMRDVGLLSDYDVLRVRVQAQNQRPELDRAKSDLHLAELSLKDYLGIPVDSTISVAGALDDYFVPVDTSFAEQDIETRHDLAALRNASVAQQNLYVLYRNARWPVLGGQLKYQWQWQNNEWDIHPRNNYAALYAGVSLSIPIWSSGATHGRAQQSKADWHRAKLDLAQAERGARLQYESAARSLTTATANESAAKLGVELAEEARHIAQVKFSQGQLTPLELDAAQLDELTARVSLADARYRRLLAAAELRLALGKTPFVN
ncbi:MAG: TolC family protein [Calditrichaeota bacterium]|nr:TolC family protein [Calditrichota bacterium]MCB9367118.1 TolC family protein [Calditrichota bacterium]MCB9391890.1 TolC family protein [Calditrichota bacterium]